MIVQIHVFRTPSQIPMLGSMAWVCRTDLVRPTRKTNNQPWKYVIPKHGTTISWSEHHEPPF